MPRARARAAGSGWGSPSSRPSRARTAATSAPARSRAAARPSVSSSRPRSHSHLTAAAHIGLSRRLEAADMNANRQTIEIVVPVFNEEATIERNVGLLLEYMRREFPFRFSIVVADNASTDSTPAIAAALAATYEEMSSLRLERKGRGLALRTAWLASEADVLSYMDVDLSTNLESFLPLVAPLLSGHSEVSIGTRLAHHAHVRRRLGREVLSRGYNLLVHAGFRARFSDAQCGFKALRRDAARLLVPHIADDGWFFDTQLLLLAERNGMRIHEVPVDWIEDLDSRVELAPTIVADLAGLWRVRRSFWRGGGNAALPAEPAMAAR